MEGLQALSITLRACLMLRGFALSRQVLARRAAQTIYVVLWGTGEAHFPQNNINQAGAAGASKRA
jgi:hypothetical protein